MESDSDHEDQSHHPTVDDDWRHAAHRRAEELSSKKAFENLTSLKHANLRPSRLSLGGSSHGGDVLTSSSLELDGADDPLVYGSPPPSRVGSSLTGGSWSPSQSSRKLLSSPGPGANRDDGCPSPRNRSSTFTEEEILIDGMERLERTRSMEGVQSDPRELLFNLIPDPVDESPEFQRIIITETSDAADEDTAKACVQIRGCLSLRDKYMSQRPFPPQDRLPDFAASGLSGAGAGAEGSSGTPPSPRKDRHPNDYRRRAVPPYDVLSEPLPRRWEGTDNVDFVMIQGVMHVAPRTESEEQQDDDNSIDSGPHEAIDFLAMDRQPKVRLHRVSSTGPTPTLFTTIPFDEFLQDFMALRRCVFAGPVSSYSYTRLELLAARYQIHVMLNETRELVAQKSVPHRDFYNVRKVDTHVHHSACMSQKHLLRFIKHKLRFVPNEVVIVREGKALTLGEVFMSLRLTAYDLSIDTLDMHAHNTFNRFDRFNLKYNPAGHSLLREIFLKTDNFMKGKYLAEITREVMGDLEAGKYQLVEWRISIYGRSAAEWDKLSAWFFENKLAHANVRWLIQIPRLFADYRRDKVVGSFQQFLENIFRPLFLVSADPSSNPPLHYFLQTVVGIDSVDDESKPEHGNLSGGPGSVPTPDMWSKAENPPYGYWMYFMFANLNVLNKFRESRGLCTFEFRPHCGEAGDLDHLVSTYLLADKINHGILLRKNAALHYLYYLSQIGIAMSPLSNNKLFLDYHKNPFPRYFEQGLNVSLSTDDPLMLHYTKDPLLEEFSVAAQVWKLSSADQCEIARNSVLQSGWERRFKRHFLGEDYSDIRETNVPKIRLMYRKETLDGELSLLPKAAAWQDVARAFVQGTPKPK